MKEQKILVQCLRYSDCDYIWITVVSVDFLDDDAIVRAFFFSVSVFLTHPGVESRSTPGCFWRRLRLRVVTGCEMHPGVDGFFCLNIWFSSNMP